MTGWKREIAEREGHTLDTGISLQDEIAQLRQDIDRVRKTKGET